MLNGGLLAACIAIVFCSVAYFFFWNRIFGFIVGILFRLTLWTQSSSAIWVDFGSAHLSLVAGRIFLRDVRYHSSNQTFRIVKCQVTWRWWIRSPAEEEDLADAVLNTDESIPEGFEWFMYNRTASFDSILSQLAASDPAIAGLQTKSRESNTQSLNPSVPDYNHTLSPTTLRSMSQRVLSIFRVPSFFSRFTRRIKRHLPDLDPKNLLPLSFTATKGAITMGNHTTENLFMAQFARATGTYGIVQSRSELDFHKQLLRVEVKDATISCIENPDFWKSGYEIGKEVHDNLVKKDPIFRHRTIPLSFTYFKKLWARCRTSFPYFKARRQRYRNPYKEKEPKKERQAHEETSHVGANFAELEYAIDRKLFEAPVLEVTYYADVPGFVPSKPIVRDSRAGQTNIADALGIEFMEIGNVDLPPEWGVDFVVDSAAIHYGPWADRQRAQIQRMFFPQIFQNNQPMEPLVPDERRCCTCLRLFLEFRGVTTIHVPFREASKNWQWDGLEDVPRNSKQREPASIQVRIGDKSSMKYLIPMIATSEGYTAELDVFMESVSVTSSLNDIRLLEANSCSTSAYLPSPLQWDSERSWNFDIVLNRPVLFLIRDHINMITDLGKDWSSGPPSNFNTFVPITYGLSLTLNTFEFNMYANDHNIIDRPLEKRQNVLFTYKADVLKCEAYIPMNKFRPLSNTVSFSVDTPNVNLSLTLPRWNTHALTSVCIENVTDIGHIAILSLSGMYTYHAEVRSDCIDQLKLDMKIPSLALKLFGWIIRHVMVLRENYFGGFTQYSTTQEYLSKLEKGIKIGDPLDLKYRPGKNNVFHLDWSLLVQNGIIALPAGLLGFERRQAVATVEGHGVDMGRCAVITIPELQLQLRLHDFFMEMSLNIDPIYISVEESCPDRVLLSHRFIQSKRPLSISGLEITANRLFGPQPHTSTYVCIWNIHVGKVKGFLTTIEGQVLASVGKAFIFCFNDPFNAPAPEFLGFVDRDATFLKVTVEAIDTTWETTPASIRLYLPEGVQLQHNNIAGIQYRKMTSISVPLVELQMLLSPNASKHWLEAGRIQTSLFVDLYKAPEGWRQDAKEQKCFLDFQDEPTHRFASLTQPNGHLDLDPSRWRNTLFLPRVSAPHLSSPSSKKQGLRSPGSASRTYHMSQRNYIDSESDSERRMSEIDRDKRLADSRPNSFAILPERAEDGHSTSLFDESDETDSSDSRNSWSDFFDSGEDRTAVDPRAHYWTFCRKFQMQHVSKELYCQSTFETENEIPSIQQRRRKAQDEAQSPQATPSTRSTLARNRMKWAATDDVDMSYTCLDVKDLTVFLTPLTATSLGEVISNHCADLTSPELRLDALILEWMAPSPGTYISVIDFNLRYSHLCVVQEVADLMNIPSSSQGLTAASSETQAIVVTDVFLEDAHLLFSIPLGRRAEASDLSPPCGQFSLRNATGSMGTLFSSPMSMSSRHRVHTPLMAMDFSCYDLLGAFAKLKSDISIGVVEWHLNRAAPEVLLAAGGALQLSVMDIFSAKRGCDGLSQLRRQQLVYSILNHTNEIMSKDLLSAVQPAFFVQKGRPQKLRQNSSWTLLFHLRHSLAELSEEQYEKLINNLKALPREEEINLWLQDHQIRWALEEGVLNMDVELIRALFVQPIRQPADVLEKNNSQPIKSLGFRVGSLRLVLDSGDALPQSSIIVNEVDIKADLIKRRLIFDAHYMSPFSSTVRSFKLNGGYIDYGSISAILSLSMDSVQITIYPSIIMFLQNAIHVWRLLPTPPGTLEDKQDKSVAKSTFIDNFLENRVAVCDVRVIVHRILVEAAAENVVFEVASRQFSSCSVIHLSQPLSNLTALDISANHTVRFDEFTVRVRTRIIGEETYGEKDRLAGVTVEGGLLCALFQNHTPQGAAVRSTIHVASVEFSVPRSAIRLYHFFEQWRQDYLLGIEVMMQALFAEIKQNPKRPLTHTSMERTDGILVDFNVSVSKVVVVLQVMHGTWLTWSAHGIIMYMKNKLRSKNATRTLGFQIASQTIKIISTVPSSSRSGDPTAQHTPKIVLDLPSLSASGAFSTEQVDLLISVGILEVTIKPSHWDALLSVQQKFGQDFNDLLLIIGERNKHRSSKSSPSQKFTPFTVIGKFEGFKIGLEGPLSTQFLECIDIDALISNTKSLQYRLLLSDLSLYLSPRPKGKKLVNPDRSQLPVLISVDLQVISYRPSPPEHPQNHLELRITKFHAILQAHMMGDIGDFFDNLQAEVLMRKEQRALELNGFKEKARKVMKTFNVNTRALAKQGAYFSSHTIQVSMLNLGVAFPLELNRSQAPEIGMDDAVTRAFLFTIKSFEFQTQRGQSGQALMKDFCFQFVSRFNPENPEDFFADRHQTLNKMLYPEMTAKLGSETTSSARIIVVSAKISGFVLDLDPSITAYAFSLVDAYRQGKQRVERLTAGIPRNAPVKDPIALALEPDDGHGSRRNRVVTSSVQISLRFMSGTVRLYTTSKDTIMFSSISPEWRGRAYHILDSDPEEFNLPELTVWCEYRTNSGTSEIISPRHDPNAPVLIFKSTVHSSSNTLRPSLLPFITGVVHNIEERMKRASWGTLRLHPSAIHSISTLNTDEQSPRTIRHPQPAPLTLQLIFSLQIDKSRLEFTCKPDANVVAGLHWESGGFVFSMSPGSRGASVSASIGGLTAGLKHGFLSEDSAHIDAKNLNLSINFANVSLPSGHFVNSVSVVVDTEFSGSIRFSRLQDFLCLKAVWLDHIPVYSGDSVESVDTPSKSNTNLALDQAPRQGFDTAIIIRVRQIFLEADLGQSISTVTLDLQTALVRTHLTSDFSELSASIKRVDVKARGNLSGHLQIPDFVFRTIRKRQEFNLKKQPLSRMLELHLTTGTLDIQIQSDWLWLLQYRAEPLEAVIYDDWSNVSPSNSADDRQLQLFFSVSGTKVIAMMTIMAIPKLLMYAGKLRASLEAQREGASRESSAFRSTRFPKPDNALSEVANAMFQSAKTKLKETDPLSYVIGQHMKLKLDELMFIVFPRSQGDNELARFIGKNVMAKLERIVQHGDLSICRDLHLSLSRMSISQLLKHGIDPRLPEQEFDFLTSSGRNFPASENVIFSLPAMDMRMITDEEILEGSRVLSYDFVSNFVRREGQEGSEKINITFNISLYSWLTVLRKTFTRELKRAQDIAEWRVGSISSIPASVARFSSPDAATSPFAFGNDRAQSPVESHPSSRSSSRPSSPMRSKSVESVMPGTPSIAIISKLPTTLSPQPMPSDPSKSADQSTMLPSVTRTVSALEQGIDKPASTETPVKKPSQIVYSVRSRKIERLTVRQLGEATPDVMHPFFTRRAGFNLEDSLPQYVHEYATLPIEEIMKALVKLYTKQLN
ncbi:hypothetical protein EW145_g3529 [Phellinidium pouzarii]|uniref:Csf1 N-terminal domain-containing protein n=1 Tax=Phellinidium pouzarii TaxID=167371 RepID=A0A4S4L6S9_9AGAM|nr:hypothetical protein EW145_g3529 [Phellinidium pouzarii]